jgi:hypothetical protein
VGFVGLILVIAIWKSPSSSPIVVLPSHNGKIDQLEAQKAIEKYQSETKEGAIKSLTISILTSVLLVGLIEFLSILLQYLVTQGERKAFMKFFGKGVFENGITAIFFTAETKGNLDWVMCPNKPDQAANAKIQGVNHIIPFEELKAVLEIKQLFDSMGVKFGIELDDVCKNKVLPNGSVLAVGLGFNCATKLIQAFCPQLFEITYEVDSDFGYETDDFKVKEGRHDNPNSNSKYDYALFARVFKDDVLHFVCAGRTADGTEAACRYLAKNWTKLLRQYDNESGKGKHDVNKQSMAVIIRHRKDNLDDCVLQHTSFES